MQTGVFLLGVIAMTVQAAYLREMLAVFRGGELTIGAALFSWLLWTAAGSGVPGRFVTRFAAPKTMFFMLFPIYGALGYATVAVIGSIHAIAGLTPGELVSYDMQLAAVIIVIAPFTVIGGLLFTLGARSLEPVMKSLSPGKTYTIEAAGAAFGGAVFSLILIAFFDNGTIAALCPLAAALFSSTQTFSRSKRLFLFTLLAPGVMMIAVVLWRSGAESYSYRGQTLLEQRDTRYGRLRVTRTGEQVTFYSDAAPLFSAPDIETSEYAVHIPMLTADAPKRILVLGGGPGGIIDEVLKYPSVTRCTCVELDPELYRLSERYLDEPWRGDPRVEPAFSDGRAYLERTDELFDVIIVSAPPPLSGAANRYYTAEFFRLAASRLTERGILSFALTGAENYIPDDLASFLASIRATLGEAFPSVSVLPGLKCRFLAGKSPGSVDLPNWERIVEKRVKYGIETLYVRDYFLRFNYSPLRTDYLVQTLDTVAAPRINTDTRPSGYFLRTIVQGNLDGSRIAGLLGKAASLPIPVPVMLFIVVASGIAAAWKGNRSGAGAVLASVMSVGLTEIALEILAIMAYQFVFGLLYGRIAVLVGAYMAGLAVGGQAGTRYIGRAGASMNVLARVQGFITAVPLAWLAVLVLHATHPGGTPGLEASFFVLTALGGLAGGFQFPIADALYRSSSGRKRVGMGAVYG
ncbi:MAG: hypothetical protein J7M24_00680, partial [Candidatus Latescibacteria bacterium]|nr:hypothetical protein [Candidatus Latescibacterota bacterium]